MGLKGYDFFTTLPDSREEIKCKVCGCPCDVRRKINGPMSFAGAMAKKNTLHDEFCCPHAEVEWHEQALGIAREIEKTSSPSLKKIMGKDLKDVVKKKKVIGEWRKSFI